MPATQTLNPKPPAPARRRHRISLGVKFTFFLLLAIGTIMSLTTWLTYRGQQRTLQDEVIQRGVTIARSMANAAAEAIWEQSGETDITLASLIHKNIPVRGTPRVPQTSLPSIFRSLLEDLRGTRYSSQSISTNTGVVELIMVDAQGIIRGHNDIKMLEKRFQPLPGLKPYTGGPLLIQDYLTPEGEKRFEIAVPILQIIPGATEKYLGAVYVRMSQSVIDVVVKQAAIKMVLVTGLLMILGLVAALILSRYLTQPINELVGGVLAIASGDLNQELQVSRTDELGELTSAFNEMASSLREKELIKGAFSTYVSSQVMEQVLRDPGQLALGGARKRVTCLFADIRGFTSMSESMEPERVVSIINAYLSLQTEIVLRNEGMLDKFVGDCVMAVFGLPFAKNDDALRAVRTAVEIQAAVHELNQTRARAGQRTVTIGVGVNTGDVVAGNMGSSQKMDYTVIGDAVNLAARLEENAEGGTILVTEGTYQEVKNRVAAEKLAPISVKGKKEKVPVYSIRGFKAPPAPG